MLGESYIEKILNGCVLIENWAGVSGSEGRSFNMFFELDGKWHQTWVDANGGRVDLEGGLKRGEMILGGVMPGEDGPPLTHEITWSRSDDGTVHQHWRTSKDSGKTWRGTLVVSSIIPSLAAQARSPRPPWSHTILWSESAPGPQVHSSLERNLHHARMAK